jgi:hypothetical protein
MPGVVAAGGADVDSVKRIAFAAGEDRGAISSVHQALAGA